MPTVARPRRAGYDDPQVAMPDVSVILPAAGSGRRFGPGAGKIFQPLSGRPVLLRAVDLFAGRDDVCQILLVVSPADREHVRQHWGHELDELGIELVDGGDTRSRSVRNALDRVVDRAALVCVHDAVRPCVSRAQIDAVFAAAARGGAAILARPVRGTVKKVDRSGTIEQTVRRDGLWEAQTPQVFDTDLLRKAYASGEDATDDAELVQRLGRAVTVVKGDAHNIKITTPADLALAEMILESALKSA